MYFLYSCCCSLDVGLLKQLVWQQRALFLKDSSCWETFHSTLITSWTPNTASKSDLDSFWLHLFPFPANPIVLQPLLRLYHHLLMYYQADSNLYYYLWIHCSNRNQYGQLSGGFAKVSHVLLTFCSHPPVSLRGNSVWEAGWCWKNLRVNNAWKDIWWCDIKKLSTEA